MEEKGEVRTTKEAGGKEWKIQGSYWETMKHNYLLTANSHSAMNFEIQVQVISVQTSQLGQFPMFLLEQEVNEWYDCVPQKSLIVLMEAFQSK